jgi:small subunit ribosomal protein S4
MSMARNTQPVLKRCRTLGISPAVMGIDKSSNKNPKQSRKKQSEYGLQLNEKQKVKFIYGVLEKQFRKYYVMATKRNGITGEMLLQILESRLDNVVFRLGLANTRREARQIVNHGHITVNGQKVDIPSYLVKPGDVISVREKSRSSVRIKEIVEENAKRVIPKWLDMDRNTLTGKVLTLSDREDIDYEVEETLIVELYSK